jgi:predicted RNase H-like HicB family nuclease
MLKNKLKYTISKEGVFFIAKAVDSELVSQGKTRKEAIKNLHEAYELLMEDE